MAYEECDKKPAPGDHSKDRSYAKLSVCKFGQLIGSKMIKIQSRDLPTKKHNWQQKLAIRRVSGPGLAACGRWSLLLLRGVLLGFFWNLGQPSAFQKDILKDNVSVVARNVGQVGCLSLMGFRGCRPGLGLLSSDGCGAPSVWELSGAWAWVWVWLMSFIGFWHIFLVDVVQLFNGFFFQ